MLPEPPPGFGSLGFPELLVLMVIVLLIWGSYRNRTGRGWPF